MNVFAIQLNIVWHDKQANHDKVRRLLEREHIPAGSMIVLPEMFATGFSMDVPAIADEVTRETENFVRTLAREEFDDRRRRRDAARWPRTQRSPGRFSR